MDKLNQNNDNHSNENLQFSTNQKCNQVTFSKNRTKQNNTGLLNSDSDQVLRVYHQNICGLGSKTNDLITSLHPNYHIYYA
jgi:hypothetical protein